ncbi:preprotein translocase subunit YajC [Companilactobacillus keshanensis]|uniref:Preprotein translocase subunit YajC n=1 Tax=Companilactobacillus keshanensis TaxID=2486003 RepID=A0ABW4BX68_9LACO|nr:preprotein translocase subunit YajC [Companilactobacillus keshanensis]
MLTLGAAAGGLSSYSFFIIIILMVVVMYFMSVRPQKKQREKREQMLKAMSDGDNVVTLGGIKGKIHSIDQEAKEVVVDCDGIYLTFDMNFIRKSTPADKTVEAKPAEPAKTEAKPEAETKPEETSTEAAPKEAKDDAKTDETKEDK